MTWLLAIAAALAQAGDRETWDTLYDALLVEAADGDVDAASRVYTELTRNLSPEHRTRAEALYWLGRSHYSLGDDSKARDTLTECVRVGVMRTPCLELLGQLELERISIRTIPTIWTFDDDAHGVVHPWRFSDKGTIRRDAQTATLLWSTLIDAEGDVLVIGFDDPSPAPTEIFFTASARFEAHLGVEAEDNMGHRYRLPRDLRVDQTRTRFTVALDKLLPMDQAAPLAPRELSRVRLLEVSGSHGASGSNALTLDDVGAR